jgi:LEA14-like dessication related protein
MTRLILLGSLLFAIGCAALKDLANIRDPSLRFQSVALENVTLASATLNVSYILDNPNPLGISLDEVEYAFFVENRQVVAGTPPNGLSIPAKGQTVLTFPANVRFIDLGEVLQTFLTRDSAGYRAEGKLGLRTPIGVLSVPLRQEGTFAVPKLPRLAFGAPRIAELSVSGARLDIPLTVTNPNSFALLLDGIGGELSISGAPIGRLATGNVGQLGPSGTRELVLPLQLSFAGAGAAAASALRAHSGTLGFRAQVDSGGSSLPIEYLQTVAFHR